MQSLTTIQTRAARDDDAAAVAALARSVAAEVGVDDTTKAEDVLHDWADPTFDRERHARVVEMDGTVVAEASLWRQPPIAWGGASVLAGYRGCGIGSALLDQVIDMARSEDAVGSLYTGANIKFADACSLIESRGFAHVRTFYRMVHRAPAGVAVPPLPEGIHIDTSLRSGALVDAMIAGHDASFIDHWNFQPWVRAEVEHWLTHPDVDPALLFIAFGPGGAVAGINLCFLDRGDGFVHGTVGVLGTTRPFRGIGLGSALLCARSPSTARRWSTSASMPRT
jgi:GNAT superfamily N-acetyltransferase